MTIIVERADLTRVCCDAIVNPANSYGFMGGGVAGVIKNVGGKEIEKEAISKAPIPIGKAIATKAGNLPCKYVIHSPTMEEPATRIGIENVKLATRAALETAVSMKLKVIALPGMGTGVGGIKPDDAAKVMVSIAKDFEKKFEKIIFVAINEQMIESFKKYLK